MGAGAFLHDSIDTSGLIVLIQGNFFTLHQKIKLHMTVLFFLIRAIEILGHSTLPLHTRLDCVYPGSIQVGPTLCWTQD